MLALVYSFLSALRVVFLCLYKGFGMAPPVCSVCQETIHNDADGDDKPFALNCGHVFHVYCARRCAAGTGRDLETMWCPSCKHDPTAPIDARYVLHLVAYIAVLLCSTCMYVHMTAALLDFANYTPGLSL